MQSADSYGTSPRESKKLCAFTGIESSCSGIYATTKEVIMRKLAGIFLLLVVVLSSCAPKPHYMTRDGKKKLKYYNDVFYGRNKQ